MFFVLNLYFRLDFKLNVILFPMDRVVNNDIKHFEKQVNPLKVKKKEKNEKDKDTV